MNWTKEEIKNCKEIARYLRKEIKFGAWFWIDSTGQYLFAKEDQKFIDSPYEKTYPLWTLTDCLEWLEERGACRFTFKELVSDMWLLEIYMQNQIKDINTKAPTKTASAQLAVLEILRGVKK